MERLILPDISPVPDVPFSFESRVIFQLARNKAGLPESGRLGDARVGTEHLLLYLAHDISVRKILEATEIPADMVIKELDRYIDHEDDNVPSIDQDGLTPTVVITIDNAKRLAHREHTRVMPAHLYAGLIEAGRGKALMVLGEFLGFPQDDREATPLIQQKLFARIPSMRAL